MQKLRNYFYTIKNLKPIQIVHRLYRKIRRPLNTLTPLVEVRNVQGNWQHCFLNRQSLFNDGSCLFLNHTGDATDWFAKQQEKLWLYNLHYFDDLTAINAKQRVDLHQQRIHSWITNNTVLQGDGWEPYPQSLRIVNWVKFALNGNTLSPQALDSLALQAHVLKQDMEYHILGNHLFANAKALIFAGCFFQGEAAEQWLNKGLQVLQKELPEQILADGGNFELTPMYHAIMLVDLLDLVNVLAAYSQCAVVSINNALHENIKKMLLWLQWMSHGDNNISFFNDSALHIAPANASIFKYASALGFMVTKPFGDDDKLQLMDFTSSGYVVVKSKQLSLIADLAAIGPDYIPGHAHADTLSFELALGEQRIFVNSGIDRYGLDAERLRQRQTVAHNTVSINGLDSSEVWSGFRVARRARIVERKIIQDNNIEKVFLAAHNGFKQQGVNCIHQRKFNIGLQYCIITDELMGDFDTALGFLHLHPDVEFIQQQDNVITLKANQLTVLVNVVGATVSIENTTFHPEFGICLPSKKLILSFTSPSVCTTLHWC